MRMRCRSIGNARGMALTILWASQIDARLRGPAQFRGLVGNGGGAFLGNRPKRLRFRAKFTVLRGARP